MGWLRWLTPVALCGVCTGFGIPVGAQSLNQGLQRSEDQFIRQFRPVPLPPVPPVPRPPVVRLRPSAAPGMQAGQETSLFILQFDRNSQIFAGANMRGRFASTELNFTRPRRWNLKRMTGVIRFTHSPVLLPSSVLVVQINGETYATANLTKENAGGGELRFTVPVDRLFDYNTLRLIVNQRMDTECEDPYDPALWTQISPDSQITFEFADDPKPTPLDFGRFPLPFFDELDVSPTELAYVRPATFSSSWLTATSRVSAYFGRLVQFRQLQSRVIDQPSASRTPVIVIGTPAEQPILSQLASQIPFPLRDGQWLDGEGTPLGAEVGLLALASVAEESQPVLIISGNTDTAVQKAVAFLTQPRNGKLGTGKAIVVNQVDEIPLAPRRDWPAYIPPRPRFTLREIGVKDTTIRGIFAAPLEFNFRALPDDLMPNTGKMTLNFAYGAGLNNNLSTVEVLIDNIAIASFGLSNPKGQTRASETFEMPAHMITPSSTMQVYFRMFPNQFDACRLTAAEQIWGTLHSDSQVDLPREEIVNLPDLQLFRTGYPFTVRQDLSETALVVPDNPSLEELGLMLEVTERLGRLSMADGIKIEAYTRSALPEAIRRDRHLIGIGLQGNDRRYPLQEALMAEGSLGLGPLLTRLRGENVLQTFTDEQGVMTQVISPWNSRRVVLNLTAQRSRALTTIQRFFALDSSFFQMGGDTILLNSETDFYYLTRLPKRLVANVSPVNRLYLFLQQNWILLPIGFLIIALGLYGFMQVYLEIIRRRNHGS